jgi:acetylornithine/succinyldiaminopimelate/putrescine aminotransferase
MPATLGSQDTIALFDKYVIPNYGRYPVALVRGEGSYVWDAEGNAISICFPAGDATLPLPVARILGEPLRRRFPELL